MGRRLSGGGAGGRRSCSSLVNLKVLNCRIHSCKLKCSTSDELVDYLRSNYPDYGRLKHLPFKKRVEQILHSTNTPFFQEQEDDQGDDRQPRKKHRRSHETEDRLHPMSLSSSDEEDGAVSTLENAIKREQVEPQVDLTKSMLRTTYAESNSAKKSKVPPAENNIELEVATDRATNKMHMVHGPSLGDAVRRGAKGSVSSCAGHGGGGLEVKGKEGPKFNDFGGMQGVLEQLMMEVIVPLYHPQLLQWLGVRPIAGLLLHGPPGCGKTKLAYAIANEAGVPFYKISAAEVVSGVAGKSEENIRDLFSKALRSAPSIVFIDEIDAIASKRENLQREVERRIVTQLMTCMDQYHRLVQPSDKHLNTKCSDSIPGYVLVIGATNRPDILDPALRRPGRFDREIVLSVPDENGRVEILSVLTSKLRLEGSFDLGKIARSTPGFVGADLVALANKAGNLAMKRIIDARKCELSRHSIDEDHSNEWWRQPWMPEEMEKLTITMADFEEAVKMVQPSLRREGFSTVPNVKWEDVGGLDYLRKEFDRYIIRCIQFPEEYMEFGVDLETGFLLYGPPGCGKTLIAKAVANEAGANFIHIKGPELLNKYVGESELAVRTLFSRARTCSPCILFFDEVDALTTKRGKEEGSVVERLLNQLLIELDGAERRQGVFVIGATNRPDVMDRALLRPGRFGKLLYVPLPSPDERGLILKAHARKKPIDADVDLSAIARMAACENFSGADLAELMNGAAMAALEEKQTSSQSCSGTIKASHFELALKKVSPSVSEEQKHYYQNLSKSFKAA